MDEDRISDGELIAAILAGRNDRFEEIVRRYQASLLRVARSRLRRHDWAEDVVQETFLCAFKSLSSYDSRFSFRTWLWTILLNQCCKRHRQDIKKPQVQAWSDQKNEATDVTASSEAAPHCVLEAKENAEQLENLLEALPETQADALRLRFFGGLKYQEIADAMGCSLSSAKNRVKWGLTKMAKLMRPGVVQ